METKYIIPLTNDTTMFVEFRTERGKVESFVVNLVCIIHGQRYEVVRFDSGHGSPHQDILDTGGNVIRKVWYHYLSNSQGLTMAVDDIEGHHEFYRERFIKWLRTN